MRTNIRLFLQRDPVTVERVEKRLRYIEAKSSRSTSEAGIFTGTSFYTKYFSFGKIAPAVSSQEIML